VKREELETTGREDEATPRRTHWHCGASPREEVGREEIHQKQSDEGKSVVRKRRRLSDDDDRRGLSIAQNP
jgi:hypothetical protein